MKNAFLKKIAPSIGKRWRQVCRYINSTCPAVLPIFFFRKSVFLKLLSALSIFCQSHQRMSVEKLRYGRMLIDIDDLWKLFDWYVMSIHILAVSSKNIAWQVYRQTAMWMYIYQHWQCSGTFSTYFCVEFTNFWQNSIVGRKFYRLFTK